MPLGSPASGKGLDVSRGSLGDEGMRRLERYVHLVEQWAPKVNLVSLEDVPHFMTRHIHPALALGPLLRAVPHRRILDVGSGSGLPGLPIAISMPGSEVTLVESRRRRANFLRHVVRDLALDNVKVVCSRVEDWEPPNFFDVIMSRAVTSPTALAALTSHCRSPAAFQLTTTGPRAAGGVALVRSAILPLGTLTTSMSVVLAHPEILKLG